MPENQYNAIEKAEKKAGDFLVAEDESKPSTFHLQVMRDGKPDHNLMGAAWAALHGGYRGNKYEGPDKQAAIAALKKLYEAEDMPLPKTKDMNDEGTYPYVEQQPVPVAVVENVTPALPPTTFAEIDEREMAAEIKENIGELNCTFKMLVDNIMVSGATPAEMSAKMNALVAEYQARITEAAKPEVEKSFIGKAVDAIAGIGERIKEAVAPAKKDNGVMFYKDTETGGLRWLGVFSNKFRDREGEIISSDAHKEFAAAVNSGEWPMPELRLWHIMAGRPLGVADTLAWDDSGFMVASGVIDKSLEPVAELMQERPFRWLMSHGMPRSEIKYDQNDKSIIVRYRSKEITALPEWAAANELTMFDFAPNEGGVEMPFSEKDRERLVKTFGTDKVASVESVLGATAQQATKDGIASKEKKTETEQAPAVVEPAQTDKPAPEAPKDPPTETKPEPAAQPAPGAEYVTRVEAAEAIAPLASAVKELTDAVIQLKAQNETAQKEKAAAVVRMTPAASLGELIAQSITRSTPSEALVKGKEATLPKEAQPQPSTGDGVYKIPFLAKLLSSNGSESVQD